VYAGAFEGGLGFDEAFYGTNGHNLSLACCPWRRHDTLRGEDRHEKETHWQTFGWDGHRLETCACSEQPPGPTRH
jgi:hypothetical protein